MSGLGGRRERASVPQFAQGAEDVLTEGRRRCRDAIPGRGDVEAWHRSVFRSVVPLDYYAGFPRQVDRRRPCLEQDVLVNGVRALPVRTVIVETERLFAAAAAALAALEVRWPSLDDAARVKGIAQV